MSAPTASRKSWLPAALTWAALALILPLGALTLLGERWLVAAVERGDIWTVRALLYFNPEWTFAETGGKEDVLEKLLFDLNENYDETKCEIALLLARIENKLRAQNTKNIRNIFSSSYEQNKFWRFMYDDSAELLNYCDYAKKFNNEEILCIASAANSPHIMSYALAQGADPNCRASNLVIYEVTCRVYACMQYVNDGYTPLHLAQDPKALRLLLDAGAIPDLYQDNPVSVLQMRFSDFYQYKKWGAECLKILIAAGAIVTQNELRSVIIEKDLIVFNIFLKGLDPSAADRDGETPLHWAAQTGWLQGVEILLNEGVDVQAIDHQGNTPLHAIASFYVGGIPLGAYSVWEERLAIMRLLLASGADPEARNHEGKTPLEVASSERSRELLLQALAEREPASATVSAP
jgi:ankyrin repeat protein